jgi:hypothetical protein
MESFLHRRQGPWFICFSMPSLLMGLRKWTTQISIGVTALVSRTTIRRILLAPCH